MTGNPTLLMRENLQRYQEVMSDRSRRQCLKVIHPAELVVWLYPTTSGDNKGPSLSRWGSNCTSPLKAWSPTSALSLSLWAHFSFAASHPTRSSCFSFTIHLPCRMKSSDHEKLSFGSCSSIKVPHSYNDNGACQTCVHCVQGHSKQVCSDMNSGPWMGSFLGKETVRNPK